MIVIAVAVIAIIGIGAYFAFAQPHDDPEPTGITIVDGSGATITLDEPLTSCTIVSTNPAMAMKILGLTDKVDNIIFYTENKSEIYYEAGFTKIDMSADKPDAKTMANIEYLQMKGVKYIIEPVSSNKLSAAVETACANANITIIKLDCFGETMLEDMEKMATLFGDTKEIKKAYSAYIELRNKVIQPVISQKTVDSDLFLFYFMGLGAFYNETGELSKTVETIYGKNATRLIDGLNPTSPTTKAPEKEGIFSSLTVINEEKSIKLLLLRGAAGDQAEQLASKWNSKSIHVYKFDYIDGLDSNVFAIESDLLSGPMDYIAYAAIGKIVGMELDFTVSELVEEYEQLYGFGPETETYIWEFLFDENGDLTSVIPSSID